MPRACAETLASELTAGELHLLIDFARKIPSTGRFLEIGTAAGGTLCEVMTAFSAADRPKFEVIDPMNYFANQFEIVRKNLQEHALNPDDVTFHIGPSAETFRATPPGQALFDLIFVDGAHNIIRVTEDFRWSRYLKSGGYLAAHDYSERQPGVRLTADRFLCRYPNYRIAAREGTLLILQKTEPSSRPEIALSDLLYAYTCSPWLQLQRSVKKRLLRWRSRSA